MNLLEQLRTLLIAEAAMPPLAPIDPMGMMTGIPMADLSGVAEYEAQADALLATASTEELRAALAAVGDPVGVIPERLRRELARRSNDVESAV